MKTTLATLAAIAFVLWVAVVIEQYLHHWIF